jgi:hypothetical protein
MAGSRSGCYRCDLSTTRLVANPTRLFHHFFWRSRLACRDNAHWHAELDCVLQRGDSPGIRCVWRRFGRIRPYWTWSLRGLEKNLALNREDGLPGKSFPPLIWHELPQAWRVRTQDGWTSPNGKYRFGYRHPGRLADVRQQDKAHAQQDFDQERVTRLELATASLGS